MFLVKDEDALVFLEEDPRNDGFAGEVIEEVSLAGLDQEELHCERDGAKSWDVEAVGISRKDPNEYRVFKRDQNRIDQGYIYVQGTPLVYGRWAEYLQEKDVSYRRTHSKYSVLVRARPLSKSTRPIGKRPRNTIPMPVATRGHSSKFKKLTTRFEEARSEKERYSGPRSGVWLTQLWGRYFYARWDGRRWQTRVYDQPLTIDWGNVDAAVAEAIEDQLRTRRCEQVNWDAIAEAKRDSHHDPETVGEVGQPKASPLDAFLSGFQRGFSGIEMRSQSVASSSAGDSLPAGVAVGKACSCYGCGKGIANGEPRFRRTVYTGDSRGGWPSKSSYGGMYRNYRGVRTVCLNCARRIDARGCAPSFFLVILMLLVPAAVALFGRFR